MIQLEYSCNEGYLEEFDKRKILTYSLLLAVLPRNRLDPPMFISNFDYDNSSSAENSTLLEGSKPEMGFCIDIPFIRIFIICIIVLELLKLIFSFVRTLKKYLIKKTSPTGNPRPNLNRMVSSNPTTRYVNS